MTKHTHKKEEEDNFRIKQDAEDWRQNDEE